MKKAAIAAALITAFPSVGHAEKWEKVISLYGWVPGLDVSIGTGFGDFESSPSGGDILSNLDMVFMGTFEGHKGRWGIVKDMLYVDLSESKSTPLGVLFANGKATVKVLAASGYVTYMFHESRTASYELAAGVRYFELDTKLALSAGTLPARTNVLKSDWFDPVIGIRGRWQIADKWSASAFADYGGFKGSSETWQVLGTFNYSINDNLEARFGYRHMDISKTVRGADVDVGLSGPIFGLTYRF